MGNKFDKYEDRISYLQGDDKLKRDIQTYNILIGESRGSKKGSPDDVLSRRCEDGFTDFSDKYGNFESLYPKKLMQKKCSFEILKDKVNMNFFKHDSENLSKDVAYSSFQNSGESLKRAQSVFEPKYNQALFISTSGGRSNIDEMIDCNDFEGWVEETQLDGIFTNKIVKVPSTKRIAEPSKISFLHRGLTLNSIEAPLKSLNKATLKGVVDRLPSEKCPSVVGMPKGSISQGYLDAVIENLVQRKSETARISSSDTLASFGNGRVMLERRFIDELKELESRQGRNLQNHFNTVMNCWEESTLQIMPVIVTSMSFSVSFPSKNLQRQLELALPVANKYDELKLFNKEKVVFAETPKGNSLPEYYSTEEVATNLIVATTKKYDMAIPELLSEQLFKVGSHFPFSGNDEATLVVTCDPGVRKTGAIEEISRHLENHDFHTFKLGESEIYKETPGGTISEVEKFCAENDKVAIFIDWTQKIFPQASMLKFLKQAVEMCQLLWITTQTYDEPIIEEHLTGCKMQSLNVKSLSDIKRFILHSNSNNDIRTRKGRTPLQIALKLGFNDIVPQLIKKDHIENVDEEGKTTLHYAAARKIDEDAEEECDKMLKILVEKGANILAKDNDGWTALHYAAYVGNKRIVTGLLGLGLDVNSKTPKGCTPLHLAIRLGHVELTQALLKRGATVDCVDGNGCNVLHCAAASGNRKLVEMLMEKIDLNLKTKGGITSLHIAAQNGHLGVVTKLLDNKASIKDTDLQGRNSLHRAALGNCEVVRLLLNEMIDSDQRAKDEQGKNCLHFATEARNMDVVKLLLDRGFNVNTKSVEGDTPLLMAIQRGYVSVVGLLLKKGANTHDINRKGFSALHTAVERGKLQILKQIIKHQGQIDVQAEDGRTALHIAAQKGCVQSTKMLLRAGARPDKTNYSVWNALHFAVGSKNKEVVMLFSHHSDFNAKTKDGQTALHLAVQSGDSSIVQVLLDRDVDAKAQDVKGMTALHYAVEENYIDVVRMLLLRNIDVNVQTSQLETPLHLAARKGSLEMCRILLIQGANCNTRSERGFTPMHCVAECSESGESLKLLIELLCVTGADIQARTSYEDTPLSLAVRNSKKEVVQVLLRRGAKVFMVYANNSTLLHIAAEANFPPEMISIFDDASPGCLEKMSEVQTSDKHWTPLHIAAMRGFHEFVQRLLILGVDKFATDVTGRTPLQLAEQNVHFKVVELLRDEEELADAFAIASSEFWQKIKATRLKREQTHNVLDNKLILSLALHRFFTFPTDYHLRTSVKSKDLAESGFFFVSDNQSLQCFYCTYEITFLEGWDNLTLEQMNQRHKLESSELFGFCCPLFTDLDIGNIPIVNPTSYKYESHRLYSLITAPFKNENVTVYNLARSGFYYAGQADNCRCHFCKLEVRGWEPGDTPDGEHRRWNPRCTFLLSSSQADNVEIGNELHHQDIEVNNPFAKLNFSKYGKHIKICSTKWVTVDNLGLNLVGDVRYRQYSTVQARLKTFSDWPKQISQKPEALVFAGFFYTGIGDRVMCFQCGGGLKDWDPKDSAWMEHAKWFSACAYLTLQKGRDFVSHVTQHYDEPSTSGYNVTSFKQTEENLSMKCRRCGKKDIDCVLLPCGHMTTCVGCARKENRCRVCHKERFAYAEVFL